MNLLDTYDNGTNDSYFFSSTGCIWGWATWKRTVDLWDENLSFLDDPHTLALLERIMGRRYFNDKLETWRRHRDSGIVYYESMVNSTLLLNSQLNIIPAKNLISNIGISKDATHACDSLKKLPRKTRTLFFKATYYLETPLKHPKYIIDH